MKTTINTSSLKDISINKYNREAVSVCEAFVEHKLNANILFIQGDSESGKSTILQCLTNDLQHDLDWNVRIAETKEIALILDQAIGKPGYSHQAFSEQFMEHDVLILDDFDYLVGMTDLQRELANVIKNVISSGRNIVIASRNPSYQFPHMFTSKGFKEVRISQPDAIHYQDNEDERKTA